MVVVTRESGICDANDVRPGGWNQKESAPCKNDNERWSVAEEGTEVLMEEGAQRSAKKLMWILRRLASYAYLPSHQRLSDSTLPQRPPAHAAHRSVWWIMKAPMTPRSVVLLCRTMMFSC